MRGRDILYFYRKWTTNLINNNYLNLTALKGEKTCVMNIRNISHTYSN